MRWVISTNQTRCASGITPVCRCCCYICCCISFSVIWVLLHRQVNIPTKTVLFIFAIHFWEIHLPASITPAKYQSCKHQLGAVLHGPLLGLCLNGKCMCGAGYSGRDCSLRYFSPGGLATQGGAAMLGMAAVGTWRSHKDMSWYGDMASVTWGCQC